MGLQPQHRKHHANLTVDTPGLPESYRHPARIIKGIRFGENVFLGGQLLLHGNGVQIPSSIERENQ